MDGVVGNPSILPKDLLGLNQEQTGGDQVLRKWLAA